MTTSRRRRDTSDVPLHETMRDIHALPINQLNARFHSSKPEGCPGYDHNADYVDNPTALLSLLAALTKYSSEIDLTFNIHVDIDADYNNNVEYAVDLGCDEHYYRADGPTFNIAVVRALIGCFEHSPAAYLLSSHKRA